MNRAEDYYDKSEGELDLTWDDVEKAAAEIIVRMNENGFVPDIIISIARSGLIPAALVSYALGNKELYTIKIDFSKVQKAGKDQELRHRPKISQELSRDVEGFKVLVIDEMAVSGSTLRVVRNYLEMKDPADVKYAVLYKQPWSQFEPDYYGVQTPMWPVFPWKRLKKD